SSAPRSPTASSSARTPASSRQPKWERTPPSAPARSSPGKCRLPISPSPVDAKTISKGGSAQPKNRHQESPMCGIVGAVAQRDVSGILLEGLKRLEYRGYDSAGMALINTSNNAIDCIKATGMVAK